MICSQKHDSQITAEKLGNPGFKKTFGLKYAYIAGGMYRGISSAKLVIEIGRAGMLGFYGAGGVDINNIEKNISTMQEELGNKPFGINFIHHYGDPRAEEKIVDLLIKKQVTNVEAAAFMNMTPSLVRYRLAGLYKDKDGKIETKNKIIGKISRPETAEAFLRPAPERTLRLLIDKGQITQEQARLAAYIPMADAICAEADSGGHTDSRVALVLIPSIIRLRDEIVSEHGYDRQIYVGAAGGIGSPEAAAAVFMLGADFILTGSINQCTKEAEISDQVKDILAKIDIQDTDYAPAGDMFETGARVQVLKKGVFFPARARRLYDLYKIYDSLEQIDQKTKDQIQNQYFKKSFDQVWEETKVFFSQRDISQIEKAEANPKHKMALIFRWYFFMTTMAALKGDLEKKVNFQVNTGPALGAFNRWVKGTVLEDWRQRETAKIGIMLMEQTAQVLRDRFAQFQGIEKSL